MTRRKGEPPAYALEEMYQTGKVRALLPEAT